MAAVPSQTGVKNLAILAFNLSLNLVNKTNVKNMAINRLAGGRLGRARPSVFPESQVSHSGYLNAAI